MANTRTFSRSFSGGEVTPELFGRIDNVKYATGLATCRNFIPLPHGPAINRPGFAYVREVKDSTKATRLLPFVYSTTQTIVIEIGEGYFRFHTQGGTLLSGGVPYEVPNSYAADDIFGIKFVQSADVLTLVHPSYPPAELRRIASTNWTYSVIPFGTSLAAPTTVSSSAKIKSGTTAILTAQGYVVTAVASDGSQSVASPPATGANYAVSSVGVGSSVSVTVASVANTGTFTNGDPISISGALAPLQLNADWIVDNVVVSGAGPYSVTFNLRTPGGGYVNGTSWSAYTSGATIQQYGALNNLFDTGAYNTLRWSAVAGAVRYNVYKYSNGLYGYCGQTTQCLFVDDNIAADLTRTPPSNNNPFAGAGSYPSAVSYFEQRRVFAGTINAPQFMWLTRSGTESDLNSSIPTRDDDAISFRIASREGSAIQHIVPLSSMIILTSSTEYRVASVNTDALTPSSISVKPQSYIGANGVTPIVANNNLVYCAARGGRVRELAYNWQASGFTTNDLSRYNPALFDGFNIVDMACQKSPYSVVWAVSTSGNLLSLTYVPEEEVAGWARHDTDGVFESVTVVAEGAEDAVYCIVRRTISGVSRRYIERMAAVYFGELADAFFVDAGVSYTGAPLTTISAGIGHLEGKTVSILADGAVHPQRVVTGGAITLEQPASTIQIGLPITADLLPLPTAVDSEAYAQGRAKAVNRVWLRLYHSSGVLAGPSADELTRYKQRTTEPYGSPPAMTTGEIEIVLDAAWGDSGQTFIRQSDPLPLTLVSMTVEVAIGA